MANMMKNLLIKWVVLISLAVASANSYAAYDLSLAIQKSALEIVSGATPVQYIEQINVTAQRILGEMQIDEDFGSSCGVRWDCTDFWLDQITTALTSAVNNLEEERERDRRDRCARAKLDWEDKQCNGVRPTRPANDQDINYNLASGFNYDRIRPALREFHQALWDDLSGNVWPNFIQYWTRAREVCTSYLISIDCRLVVDNYFGQAWGSTGYAAWEQSAAASDARSSHNGQTCRNIAAAKAADRCE